MAPDLIPYFPLTHAATHETGPWEWPNGKLLFCLPSTHCPFYDRITTFLGETPLFPYQFMCFGWCCPTQVPGVGIWARTSWLGQFISLVTVTGPETGTGSKWVQWQLISGFLLEWHKKALWFHKIVNNKEANMEVPGVTPQGLRMRAAQSKASQNMKRELHEEIMGAPESNCAWSK